MIDLARKTLSRRRDNRAACVIFTHRNVVRSRLMTLREATEKMAPFAYLL
ncbi:hypothetical protein HQ563_15890 [bacterium]|nr:hypothetical protein [bacterium]